MQQTHFWTTEVHTMSNYQKVHHTHHMSVNKWAKDLFYTICAERELFATPETLQIKVK